MKNILVLSYYFHPDLSAGSFRNTALVKELSEQVKGRGIVTVITTQPNRYKSYSDKAREYEEIGENIRIHRIMVPPHQNGFKDQINSYRVYYKKVCAIVKKMPVSLVYASSSKLFTAYLGRVIAQSKHCPLYLDIRDIFVETMVDIVKCPAIVKSAIVKCVEIFIERPTFKAAIHINMVSEGFKEYVRKISTANFTFYPNGIDNEFLNLKKSNGTGKKIITYAGNIGEGQGLEKVIPEAAKLLGDEYVFKVFGDGGTRGLLIRELTENNITNVQVLDPVKRETLVDIYSKSDFLFLHLNNYKAFERVLPSKIFEYAATDLPMIAGVGGFAKHFIDNNVSNSYTFSPCDSVALASWIKSYNYRLQERKEFVEKFKRSNISTKLAASIVSYLQEN